MNMNIGGSSSSPPANPVGQCNNDKLLQPRERRRATTQAEAVQLALAVVMKNKSREYAVNKLVNEFYSGKEGGKDHEALHIALFTELSKLESSTNEDAKPFEFQGKMYTLRQDSKKIGGYFLEQSEESESSSDPSIEGEDKSEGPQTRGRRAETIYLDTSEESTTVENTTNEASSNQEQYGDVVEVYCRKGSTGGLAQYGEQLTSVKIVHTPHDTGSVDESRQEELKKFIADGNTVRNYIASTDRDSIDRNQLIGDVVLYDEETFQIIEIIVFEFEVDDEELHKHESLKNSERNIVIIAITTGDGSRVEEKVDKSVKEILTTFFNNHLQNHRQDEIEAQFSEVESRMRIYKDVTKLMGDRGEIYRIFQRIMRDPKVNLVVDTRLLPLAVSLGRVK